MKTIQQTYTINAPQKEVWNALVNPKDIEAWGGGPNAIMSEVVGSKFSLWDGEIYGTNLTIEPQSRLVQEWFTKDVKEPTRVEFSLKPVDGSTTVLNLLHENVLDDKYESIDEGWREYYLGPMKKYLEK